jgi:hypothetical protein
MSARYCGHIPSIVCAQWPAFGSRHRYTHSACRNAAALDALIRVRHHPATIHMIAVASHAMNDASSENGRVAPGFAVGTIPVVLFTAACISIVINKLPLVRQ